MLLLFAVVDPSVQLISKLLLYIKVAQRKRHEDAIDMHKEQIAENMAAASHGNLCDITILRKRERTTSPKLDKATSSGMLEID